MVKSFGIVEIFNNIFDKLNMIKLRTLIKEELHPLDENLLTIEKINYFGQTTGSDDYNAKVLYRKGSVGRLYLVLFFSLISSLSGKYPMAGNNWRLLIKVPFALIVCAVIPEFAKPFDSMVKLKDKVNSSFGKRGAAKSKTQTPVS